MRHLLVDEVDALDVSPGRFAAESGMITFAVEGVITRRSTWETCASCATLSSTAMWTDPQRVFWERRFGVARAGQPGSRARTASMVSEVLGSTVISVAFCWLFASRCHSLRYWGGPSKYSVQIPGMTLKP